jgi:2',3'-cyclic-nucleotide 2'-phosphodiesterase (5'-nucleotidase family)
LNSYNIIGYQAYNVAAQDFIGGLDFIREIQKTAKFPFISANLADSITNQLLFQPYIIHKIGKKRFGIVGVTSEYQIPMPGVKVLPIDEVLKKIIKELRKKTDYIILLVYLDRNYENEFLSKSYDVDFVLTSGSYRYSRDLEDRNNMLIARCGNIGKYLGIIKFDLVNDKVKLANISSKLSQISYAQRRLDSFKDSAGNKSLEEYYADQPSVLNAINSMKNQVEILSIEIQQAVNPVSYDLIELDANIPDDPAIRAKLDDLKNITDKIQNQPLNLH